MSAQPRSRIGGAFSVWRPLRLPTFRNLLIANVFGDVGTFMHSVGAAWWMAVGEHAGVPTALMWAGLGSIATIGLGLRWRLPETTMDVTP